MLFILAACTGSTTISLDTKGGGADSVTDTQTQDTSQPPVDTGETGDTGGQPSQYPFCGTLAGVVDVGTEWTYEYAYGGGGAGGYVKTRTVTDINEGTLRILEEWVYESGASSYTYDYDDAYVCDDDGMWLMGQTVSYDYGEHGGGGTQYTLALDTPALIVPIDAEFGDSWDTVYNGMYTYTNGQTSPMKYTLGNIVVGEETVDVPYGEVDALHVFQEYSSAGGGGYDVYYSKDIGLVEDYQWKMTDYQP